MLKNQKKLKSIEKKQEKISYKVFIYFKLKMLIILLSIKNNIINIYCCIKCTILNMLLTFIIHLQL